MRDRDEQLREILRRSQAVRERQRAASRLRACAAAACACAALLIAACAYLPRITRAQTGGAMTAYGSLLLAAPYVGYIVVGVLAFALGVCAALLGVYWKRLRPRGRARA